MAKRYSERHCSFEAEKYYHIFNRGNQGQQIFFNDADRRRFLDRFHRLLHPYVRLFAYCLLDNHFHLLIQIRSEQEIDAVTPPEFILNTGNPSKIHTRVSEAFRRLFLAYAKSINRQQEIKGSIFQKTVRRILVDNDLYLARLVHYIHYNPVHHGLVSQFEDFRWSSYRSIVEHDDRYLESAAILRLFGSQQQFVTMHHRDCDNDIISHLIPFDDD